MTKREMFGSLGKLWRSFKRYPVAVLMAGLAGGISIGWLLGPKAAVEQIAIPPAKPTVYTTLSNAELKNKSLQLVKAIRDLTRSYYQEDERLRMIADEKSGTTASQAEREKIRKAWLDDSAKVHDQYLNRYKNNFWADAILLRQAIVAKVGGVPGSENPILFQHPTNILGVEQVANSLDLLGKSLAANQQAQP